MTDTDSTDRARAAIARHTRLVPDFPSPGIAFKDLTPVLADAQGLSTVTDALAQAGAGVDLVAGIDARGFLLGGAIALRLGVGVLAIRKAGKLPPPVRTATYSLEYGTASLEVPAEGVDLRGRRVLVVDDVLATGGTLNAAIGLLVAAGAVVSAAAVVMEIDGLGGRDAVESAHPGIVLTGLTTGEDYHREEVDQPATADGVGASGRRGEEVHMTEQPTVRESNASVPPNDSADPSAAETTGLRSTVVSSSSTSRRVRARLARRMTATRNPIRPVLEPLVALHRDLFPKADVAVLQRAYDIADQYHEGQFRKSGDPYITHPLAVASILADLGMDTTTLIAALLHDTVEDTGYSLDALAADFGDEVAHLVDGVTKLDKVALGNAAEAETIRKMIIAMARDPRVLVIKVADRLHNMRTMRFLPPEKQARKARETLEVIAPLAHRLGMATVKWELEDLSFAILHPKRYEEIVRLVADRAPSRDTYLARVRTDITTALGGSRIDATVEGRPKHYWSIYQKMIVKGKEFDDIHDLVGMRILCDQIRDCYAAVGVVHSLWQPMAGRFKDYIAQPRFGVYQSLHTTVIGPEGKPLEVQIRTRDMHRTAEFGIAAHWRYKEARGRNSGKHDDAAEIDDMAWMRQLLDWQREAADPGEFLESLRYDLAVKEIFAFTPKGDVITLPAGSTPVDFAYAVHTEVGHRCIGARVNGRLVALERTLENGEVVEVFTSKAPNAGPSRDWAMFVVSPRAKTKIRQWFAKERREEALDSGKDAITKEVRRGGLPLQRLMSAESMGSIATELRYADVSALYTAIGEGHVSARHVVGRLVAALGGLDDAEEELAERSTPSTMPTRPRQTGDAGVLVSGADGVTAKLAKCCTPVPGDEILGFVTRGGGISVHRTDCTNADALQEQSERIIDVTWAPSPSSVFLVAIQVEALDRSRLLSDVTRVLADERVNILSASVTTSRDRVAISKFTFEMGDPKHLGHVLNVVRNVEGVYDVYRVTSAA